MLQANNFAALSFDTSKLSGSAESDPEALLIDRVVAGDHEAFAALLKPYERMIYMSALGIVGNEADAEEVAQEATFRSLPRFRRESKFSTWLVQIAINEAKMKLRKDRRHLYESVEQGRQTEEGEYVPREFADWREIPSSALETKELREARLQMRDALAPGVQP
jgi:RNA polymerase sigma-70 factor (ECF subfamily)